MKEVATDIFFCIVTYIWMKKFQSTIIDWMDADLNASLQMYEKGGVYYW